MTNITTNLTIQHFIDHHEVVFTELHEGVDGNGVEYHEIVLDFINPVTGAVDQVQFDMCDQYENLNRIFYVADSNKAEAQEELEMENLSDLYDHLHHDNKN